MKIKNVKVTMSYVGLTAGDTPREVSYMPLARISYVEKEHHSKTVLLDETLVPDKKYFKGWIIGVSYFAGITKDSCQIYDENGNRTGTVSIEEFGKPIQANDDDFICLKGRLASLIDRNGKRIGGRELTDEEYKAFTGG